MRDKPGNNSDAWLEDESTVSRAYGELKQPGPPAHLDQAILAEARRAIATKPDNVVIKVQRWRQWAMPAALAATVVFAVPLVVRVFTSEQLYTVPETATMKAEQSVLEAEPTQSRGALENIAMKTESDDVAEPAMPAGRTPAQIPSASESGPSPQPVFASERADLLPSGEAREAGKNGFAETVMEDRTLVDAATSTPAAAPVTAETEFAGPATDEIFAVAPPRVDDGVVESYNDKRRDTRMAGAAAEQSPPGESRLSKTATAIAPAAADRLSAMQDSAEADYRPGRFSPATGDPEEIEQTVLEPEPWLTEIADLHRRGLIRTARRELGEFLQTYPDYNLPVDYPLLATDALFDDENAGAKTGDIVPEAESWLRGIGMMARRGDIDQARTQLAEFFAIYPDYPLPADFPLTREDAGPIER